jgi:predicted NodU family carbamoyl transferase
LRKEGIVKRNDYNVIYNGIEVVDQHIYESRKFKEVELEDVSRLLKEGNIIGFVNGRCEVGPRALGNRSILCDASYPNMKDKINRIKKREMYRPFAPACLKEDASKYFKSLHFENMEAMQYVVDVKEEYKEQLEPIVHVDGTARLQTVTKENNEVFYNLLKLHGGVLLNTSFNLAGKPTLNHLSDAFEMLDKTTLDYVVWGKDGKYKLYQ